MHGQYFISIDRQVISEEDVFLWLSRGDVKTESEMVAAQDQSLQTKYQATKMQQIETNRKCRLCQQLDELVDHIISACPVLAKGKFIKIHDSVC
jgi:hypothetical protein